MGPLGRNLIRRMHFQNHARHSGRKHILELQQCSCRCKCNMFVFCWPHGPFRIRTLARDLCAIIVQSPRCAHTSLRHIHFFCKFTVFKNMLAIRVRSTFSIFGLFHVDANAACSCLGRYMGLSVRVLMASWAFQNLHSRS